MTGFQRYTLLTVGLVFVLIVIGGTVRATESGLGCPDWPRCHGSFIPRWEKHTLIEYSHRMAASIVGLMIFGVAFWAWRSYRHVRSISLPAAATVVLLLVQGGLGGLTVIHELPPEISTVHLATALTILGLLVLITVAAFAHEREMPSVRLAAGLPALAAAAMALTLTVMLFGAYATGAGYSLACDGWPLCNGQVVPSGGGATESVQLIFAHRLLAALLGIALVLLLVRAWSGRAAAPLAANLALAAVLIYVLQALVGASNIWTEAADIVQIAHLGVGTLLWAILALMNVRLFDLPRLLDAGSQRRAGSSHLAGAAR